MNRQQLEQRLRQGQFDQQVDPSLHRRIMAAVAASNDRALALAGRSQTWRPRTLVLAGGLAASLIVAIIAWIVVAPQSPKPSASLSLAPIQQLFEQPLATHLPIAALQVSQLEEEWLALQTDLARLRPRLNWPPDPA